MKFPRYIHLIFLLWSLPLWERGLKSLVIVAHGGGVVVAPLVGAWIEIDYDRKYDASDFVAPLVGAWIEM